MGAAQDILDMPGSSVAQTKPYDLWRRSVQETELVKIRVLGDNHKSMTASVFPNGRIVGNRETDVLHMNALRIQVSEKMDQARRKILIEQ